MKNSERREGIELFAAALAEFWPQEDEPKADDRADAADPAPEPAPKGRAKAAKSAKSAKGVPSIPIVRASDEPSPVAAPDPAEPVPAPGPGADRPDPASPARPDDPASPAGSRSSGASRTSGAYSRGGTLLGGLAIVLSVVVAVTTVLTLGGGGTEEEPASAVRPSPTTTIPPSPAATRPSSRELAGSPGASTSQGSCTQACETPLTEEASRRAPVDAVAHEDGGGGSSLRTVRLVGMVAIAAGILLALRALWELRRGRTDPLPASAGTTPDAASPPVPTTPAAGATSPAPTTPDAPATPLAPAPSGAAAAPAEPAGPVATAEPPAPVATAEPVAPVAPAEPVAPVATVVTAEPSAPVAPAQPPAPAAPAKPAARRRRAGRERPERTDEMAAGRIGAALVHLAASVKPQKGRPYPQPRVVRVNDGRIDVLLSKAHPSPPSPWRPEASGLAWVLDADVPLPPTEEILPLPSLVTIGTSESNVLADLEAYGVTGTRESEILLDLEAYGVVALVGDEDACRSMARAMAVELSARARGLATVEVIGRPLGEALAGLDGVDHHETWDDVDTAAIATSARLLDTGGWPHTWAARASGRIFDGWEARVWITGASQQKPYLDALDAIATRPGAGSVLLVVGDDPGRGLRIHVDGQGQFRIPDLQLRGHAWALAPTRSAG